MTERNPVSLSIVLREDRESHIGRQTIEPEEDFNFIFDDDAHGESRLEIENTNMFTIPEWLEEWEKTIKSILEEASLPTKAHPAEQTYAFGDDNLFEGEFDSVANF